MMDENQYLNDFEKRLQDSLVSLCTAYDMMGGQILENDDIEVKFTDCLAADYLPEAVREFNKYPEAAVAWAGFLGMAVAKLWDENWEAYKAAGYRNFLGDRGFDDMDEHILRDILGWKLDSEQALKISAMLSNCAIEALTMIRHENIEPQTPRSFYVFARTVQVIYRIGASIELFLMGYKYERL